MRHRLDVALLSAFLVAFTLATSALAQPADLVLRGGRVITVDKDWRVAHAAAIRDGRFVAVGDDEVMIGHIVIPTIPSTRAAVALPLVCCGGGPHWP